MLNRIHKTSTLVWQPGTFSV